MGFCRVFKANPSSFHLGINDAQPHSSVPHGRRDGSHQTGENLALLGTSPCYPWVPALASLGTNHLPPWASVTPIPEYQSPHPCACHSIPGYQSPHPWYQSPHPWVPVSTIPGYQSAPCLSTSHLFSGACHPTPGYQSPPSLIPSTSIPGYPSPLFLGASHLHSWVTTHCHP